MKEARQLNFKEAYGSTIQYYLEQARDSVVNMLTSPKVALLAGFAGLTVAGCATAPQLSTYEAAQVQPTENEISGGLDVAVDTGRTFRGRLVSESAVTKVSPYGTKGNVSVIGEAYIESNQVKEVNATIDHTVQEDGFSWSAGATGLAFPGASPTAEVYGQFQTNVIQSPGFSADAFIYAMLDIGSVGGLYSMAGFKNKSKINDHDIESAIFIAYDGHHMWDESDFSNIELQLSTPIKIGEEEVKLKFEASKGLNDVEDTVTVGAKWGF